MPLAALALMAALICRSARNLTLRSAGQLIIATSGYQSDPRLLSIYIYTDFYNLIDLYIYIYATKKNLSLGRNHSNIDITARRYNRSTKQLIGKQFTVFETFNLKLVQYVEYFQNIL